MTFPALTTVKPLPSAGAHPPLCWPPPTYNGGIYLPAANLLEDLKALNLHDRTFALVENGSWAPMSAKLMAAKIGELKNCIVLDAKVTVRGRLTATQDAELEACAAAVAASM